MDDPEEKSWEASVTLKKIKQKDQGVFEVLEGTDLAYHQRRGDKKPFGGVILKEIKGEYKCLAAFNFTDDELKTLSPVSFPLSSVAFGDKENRKEGKGKKQAEDQQLEEEGQLSLHFAENESLEIKIEPKESHLETAWPKSHMS